MTDCLRLTVVHAVMLALSTRRLLRVAHGDLTSVSTSESATGRRRNSAFTDRLCSTSEQCRTTRRQRNDTTHCWPVTCASPCTAARPTDIYISASSSSSSSGRRQCKCDTARWLTSWPHDDRHGHHNWRSHSPGGRTCLAFLHTNRYWQNETSFYHATLYCRRVSVCPSVRPPVSLSVTSRHCNRTSKHRIMWMWIKPYDSLRL